jgi:integrase
MDQEEADTAVTTGKNPSKVKFTDLGLRRMTVANQLKKISDWQNKKRLNELNKERARDGQPALNELPAALKAKPKKQAVLWDTGVKGLSLLISAGGTKTFRAQFKLHGRWIVHTLGRYGELSNADPEREDAQVGEARRLFVDYKDKASKGIDPRQSSVVEANKNTFGYVVDRYIQDYARHKQRTWDQTERVLKRVGTAAGWLQKPIDDISKNDVRELLRGYVNEGHPYKAANTDAWLRSLWKWAYREDYVAAQIMDGVKIEYEKRFRERVYSDDDIRAIWQAATKLDPVGGAYFKLLLLLAPRKTALALMKWADLDPQLTLWTTPFELTKSRKSSKKRTYLTPLPALATRILKGLPHEGERVFPTLPMAQGRAGQMTFKDRRLNDKLIKAGAPADFYPHAIRHTIATFLQEYPLWERGLVLDHAEQGVTSGYSHGYALKRKRELLEEWAAHIESLLVPSGVALLQ